LADALGAEDDVVRAHFDTLIVIGVSRGVAAFERVKAAVKVTFLPFSLSTFTFAKDACAIFALSAIATSPNCTWLTNWLKLINGSASRTSVPLKIGGNWMKTLGFAPDPNAIPAFETSEVVSTETTRPLPLARNAGGPVSTE